MGPPKRQAQHCLYPRKKSFRTEEEWTVFFIGRTAGPAFTQTSGWFQRSVEALWRLQKKLPAALVPESYPGYKNIEITNFSSSWEDGLAFCAVYHTFLPTRIPYDTLNLVDKKENLDLAFKTGESVGITATLTVEEMLKSDGPDWQKVLGYVENIFRHFEMIVF
nr:cytospin-A-like [Labrus bergylta]